LSALKNHRALELEDIHNTERRVEWYGWVDQAVKAGDALFTPPELKKIPGRPPG